MPRSRKGWRKVRIERRARKCLRVRVQFRECVQSAGVTAPDQRRECVDGGAVAIEDAQYMQVL